MARAERPSLEEIDLLLGSFRAWLTELDEASLARLSSVEEGERATAFTSESPDATVDVHTLLGELVALQQEVRILSRSGKAAREGLEAAGGAMQEVLRDVRENLAGGAASRFERLEQSLDSLRTTLTRHRQEEAVEVKAEARLTSARCLLEVAEVLERGRQFAAGAGARLGWRRRFLPTGLLDAYGEGYEIALRKLETTLRENGVERIECVGERFDPATMTAVEKEPRDVDELRVLEEVRPGYRAGDRVLRFAEVKVAVPASPGPAGE
jgi:molecular chaperone GrpE (heat shock protein)